MAPFGETAREGGVQWVGRELESFEAKNCPRPQYHFVPEATIWAPEGVYFDFMQERYLLIRSQSVSFKD